MVNHLPKFAAFAVTPDRIRVDPSEWESVLGSWAYLAEAHLALPDSDFSSQTAQDVSVSIFLISLMNECATHGTIILGGGPAGRRLLRSTYGLITRLLASPACPPALRQWDFLADASEAFHAKNRDREMLSKLLQADPDAITVALSGLKKSLIKHLDAGINGDVRFIQEQLSRLNPLISASPDAAAFLLAGSDFLDGLAVCYTIMNPPLRKVLILTTFLCLKGLAAQPYPKYALLTDVLYSLRASATAHKEGTLNVDDSLVAELVTSTPILTIAERSMEHEPVFANRAKGVLADLAAFRKPGYVVGLKRPRPRRPKIDKGKGVAREHDEDDVRAMEARRMSQISHVQDIIPGLGSGFISRLLDEYGSDPEQVVAHLLEGSLPSHLQNADRNEELKYEGHQTNDVIDVEPAAAALSSRRNKYDDDALDRLVVDSSSLHWGKNNPEKTADDILKDKSGAPDKERILAALGTFDSDSDERDDTYDVADVGDTVDAPNDESAGPENEEALFRAYQTDFDIFNRDPATRRGRPRALLREETGMTDEAIEGWAIMLARNPRHKRRLEAKFTSFTGAQTELAPTSWRPDSGAEDSGQSGSGGPSFRGGGGRGRGRGRGRGGRGGDVAGASNDKGTENARKHKEANKGARANHNRRDQRARKMARGGFPG